MNPYKHRKKRITQYGIVFDNADELKRYELLMLRYRAGEITEPEVHPQFEIVINEQKICKYVADFRYQERTLGLIVEDLKPAAWFKKQQRKKGIVVREWKERKPILSDIYKLKKKLVAAQYGIDIQEVWK